MLSFNSSNIASKTRTIGRRMFLLNTIKAVVLLGIFGRLASLQINEATKYRSLADKNRFRETKFAPPRGIIKDYFDSKIASNTRVYQLHITPENTPDIEKLLIRLKGLIGLSDRQTSLILKKIKKQKKWETIVISDNLNWSEFSRLNLFLHELEGAQPVVSIARVYKNNASAHAIGYVSEISPRVLALEKQV
jgi:penicillin-binding protein 2